MANTIPMLHSKIWSILTPSGNFRGPRLKTNLNTDFLKSIAIVSRLIDHISGAFFPEDGIFRWIGQLSFPSSATA